MIQRLLAAFTLLRSRGVKDPIYCRLVLREKGTVGWLWRNPSLASRPLTSGERFTLSLRDSSDVEITWVPIFSAKMDGDRRAVHYASWFIDQAPTVSGGSHQCIDQFEFGAGDWSRVASDFYLVRCGSYHHRGSCRWRQPSEDARGWIRDPERFQVSANVRERVIAAVETPLPSGERLTIRRIFDDSVMALD